MRSNLTSNPHVAAVVRSAPALVLSGTVDPALTHRLTGVLHSLYVIAAVLGILLAVSVLLALWAFRRNRGMEPKA